jgi:SAM-dependent methyltransferase
MCSTFVAPNAHLTPIERRFRDNRPADVAFRLGNYAKALLLRIFLFRGCSVLELGCGFGSNILKFEASGTSHVTFVDNDYGNIDEIRRRLANRKHLPGAISSYETHLFEYTCDFSTKFLTSRYNFVIAMYSLQHVAKDMLSLPFFFRSCSMSLISNGLFIAILPNYERLVKSTGPDRQLPNAEKLFSIDTGPEFFSGKSGIPYSFQVNGQQIFSEYTLLISDVLDASSEFFKSYFTGSISDFVGKYEQEYPSLARSLYTFILKKGRSRQERSADFDLYNLYDVIILQKK